MSAREVTDEVFARIEKFDLIILNFANPDMVGHTGVVAAGIKAVETIDECLARIVPAVLAQGGACLITADHGNCEQMRNPGWLAQYRAHHQPRSLHLCRGERRDASGSRTAFWPTWRRRCFFCSACRSPTEMTGRNLLVPTEQSEFKLIPPRPRSLPA